MNYRVMQVVFEELQKKMDNPHYVPGNNKIFMDVKEDKKSILTYIHELTHKTLTENITVGIVYFSMSRIYEMLIDRFCVRFGFEVQKYMRKYFISNRLSKRKMRFIMEHQTDIMRYLGRQRDIYEFCEFCTEYYRRYCSLLKYTQLIQEGTAVWLSVNFDYSICLSEEDAAAFQSFAEEQKDIYRDSSRVPEDYYKGYQIAEKIAEKFGDSSVMMFSLLAMSPPILSDDLIGCRDEEFDRLLEQKINCDEIWQKIEGMDVEIFKALSECPETQYRQIYQRIYGVEPDDFNTDVIPFFDNKAVINAVNCFEGRLFINENVMEYFDSDEHVSPKPMAYTKTKEGILQCEDEDELEDYIVKYHRNNPKAWGTEWESDASSDFGQDGDENMQIHLENMTNYMKDVLRLSGEEQKHE